jgi:hypothetical protein
MKKLFLLTVLMATFLFGKEFTINLIGDGEKENHTLKLEFQIDEENKLIGQQKYDIRNLGKPNSLKVITAPGLKGTLKDEREIIVYYKTSLNVAGLDIRNLYKVGHTRVYGEENNVTINFDKDHFRNISSYLRYHNIKAESVKDIDNLYGTWTEIE